MSRRNFEFFAFTKMVAPAIAAIVIVSLSTMNACTPSDRTTAGRDEEESMTQAAAEAEAAEAQLAHENAQVSKDKPAQTAETKTAAKKSGHEKPVAVAKKDKPSRSIASRGGVYVVQVGAFKVKENAEKLSAKLKDAGYPVQMQTIEHSKNGLLHLVRFEPTANRAEAETVIEDLHAKQDLRAQIVPVAQ